MNYLASPPLVVAYALAGRMDADIFDEPLGEGSDGEPVYLRDIWPSQQEISETVEQSVKSEMFTGSYGEVFEGDDNWNGLDVPEGDRYAWDDGSTYVKLPPYFENMPGEAPDSFERVEGARILALLGPQDYAVALDERGRSFSTLEFSRWLAGRRKRRRKR